jgi:hypothetical protein
MLMVATDDVFTPVRTSWFHATTVDDWFTKVVTDRPYVHLGTRAAAEHRTQRVTRSGPRTLEAHDLYVVRLRHDAEVDPRIHEDSNDWPEFVDGTFAPVIAYRNEYEDFGSLSLLADPRALEIVRIETILPH